MSGVFGMFSPFGNQAAQTTYLGLFALQHRGEQSCGIVVSDGDEMGMKKSVGLVAHVLPDALSSLSGRLALGHVSSSPGAGQYVSNALPLLFESHYGPIGLSLDGNLTNGASLRRRMLEQGVLLHSTTDSELIAHLIGEQRETSVEAALFKAAPNLTGAFALVIATRDRLIGFRDPMGIRPLCIGIKDDAWFLASESCALDTIGATLVRDVSPGEMCVIDSGGLRSYQLTPSPRSAFCVFEFIYFARADSVIDGKSVHEVRKQFGRRLARETKIEADLIVPAPDSALSAAIGYAEESKIAFDIALAKNRYVGRTFVQSTQKLREKGVRLKLNPIASTVRGKRIILVDDSIVRGTTSGHTIKILREAGAKEVHMVVASPPFSHPCQYGIHVPTPEELIAARRSKEEICALIGADSLSYLSLDGLYDALGIENQAGCAACFGGGFPISHAEINSVL